MPVDFLALAKKVGYYTVGFFVKSVSGFVSIQSENDSGATQSGVGLPVTTNEWSYVTNTIKVNQTDTFSRAFILGAAAGTAKEMYIDALTLHIGDEAYPWTPSPYDRVPSVDFNKTFTLGTSTSLFNFTAENGDLNEMTVIAKYVRTSTGDSGYLKASLGYSRASGAAPKYGATTLITTDGAAGALTGLTLSRSGSVITVNIESIASAGNAPTLYVTVETNSKSITVL